MDSVTVVGDELQTPNNQNQNSNQRGYSMDLPHIRWGLRNKTSQRYHRIKPFKQRENKRGWRWWTQWLWSGMNSKTPNNQNQNSNQRGYFGQTFLISGGKGHQSFLDLVAKDYSVPIRWQRASIFLRSGGKVLRSSSDMVAKGCSVTKRRSSLYWSGPSWWCWSGPWRQRRRRSTTWTKAWRRSATRTQASLW